MKFIAIIVNVCVFFNAKFSLEIFDFSSDFYALAFLRFAWSNVDSLNHNFKQLNSIGGNLILKVK